ncbi:SdrD B-like domain-containing protein [Cellulomonas sp. NPDC058312]|uniref:SdrD B-like domain-containing protein n=1 Tax=Cellulomonas sp. NPDC058312 TaxID=3346441 RepID=UPI0036E77437
MTTGTGHGSALVAIGRPVRWLTACVTVLALVLVGMLVAVPGVAQAADGDRGTLTVRKTASATTARPGDRVTWTVEVTCESIIAMCEDVVVADAVPEPFVLDADGVTVQAEQTGQAVVAVTGRDARVELRETDGNHPGSVGLAAGQSVSVLLRTTLPAGTPLSWDGRSVTNTADATATNADPASADATVAVAVPVTPQVALTKQVAPSDQVAGETGDVTVTLGARNTSPVAATALTVADPGASAPAAFGPGTPLELRGFGAWTAPEGATAVSVDLTTADGTTTVGPFAPGTPLGTGSVDPAAVTAVTLRFAGDGTPEGTILAGGAAGSVALVLGQSGAAPRDTTTRVTNTAAAALTTPRGDATATASATFQINPVTVEVTAGKTFDGAGRAEVVAGQPSVVRLTARNSSNTALSALRLTEPSGGTASPLGDPADGLLGFDGFGTAGDGQVPASAWPAGATGATVTFVGTGPGTGVALPVAAPTGATSTWPAAPAGAVVTGFAVAYTGTLPAGAAATVPFRVLTDGAWSATHAFTNEVTVDGDAADGSVASPRTASAALTVQPRRVVTTTSKTLTQQAAGAPLPGAVGQELVATITGRISADTTVPVGSLVVEDVAGGDAGSTLWDAAALARVGSVQVPAGSRVEVLVRQGGSWTTVAGPTTDAASLLDLAVPAGVDGVRFVYTSTGASLPVDGTFAPRVALVMALDQARPAGTTLRNTATSTGTGTGVGAGLDGVSPGTDDVTFGPGDDPVDIRRVDASKSWRDASALIGVDNTEPGAQRPTNRLTMRVQNVTGVPVGTLRLTDPDPQTAGNAFDHVDLTRLAVTAPAGTQSLAVVLRGADGTVLHDLASAAAVAALSAADLADVVSVEARATGTIPDSAALVVVADTVLRAQTRAGEPILGTADGAPSTTLTNTLRGDLGDGTPADPAQAGTVLYPEALQPLDGALSKSVSPGTGTRYAADADRTVRLSLTSRRTSDAAVSRPAQYVLEDTSEQFWDAFDLVGLEALAGVSAADGAGYTAAVQYRVAGAWTDAVTSDLPAGVSTTMPPLPDGAAALPDGTTGADVTGVRVTFTAPAGSWFANRQVGGFEGPTALFTLSPRATLRSTGAEVPAGTLTNVVTGTVQAEHQPTPVVLDPAQATYEVTPGVVDATVTKTPTTTTTGPGARLPFRLTVTNTGTAPIVDPVLTDVLPTDAGTAQLVYDPDAYGAATVTATPAGAAIAAVEPVVTADAGQVRVTFPAGTRLMPGEQVVATVPMAVRAGTPAGTVLTNTFVLDAADGFTRSAQAQVDVVALPNYLRVKDVAEDLAPGATPTGVVNTSSNGQECVSADGFYRTPCLVRTQPGGTETWRLRVTNTGNLPTASATLVDVLPAAGDTGTSRSQSTSARGSVWATEFLGDLQLTGLPAGAVSAVSYLLAGETCAYTGDPRSADPFGTGCAADVWTPADEVDDLTQVRGLRIDLDFAADDLDPGETVTATFRTRSATSYDPAAADVDAPAWNTMVVTTASVTPSGLEHETLEPNRAGVAVHRTYAVGDRVWFDRDGDGRQGDGEPGVPGVTVRVYPAGSDVPVATTTTDADGRYLVDLLPAGDYRVQFVLDGDLAARYGFTHAGSGDAAGDSDADPATGWTRTVTLGAGEPRVRPVVAGDGAQADYVDPTVDAGLVLRAAATPGDEAGTTPGEDGPPAGSDPAPTASPAAGSGSTAAGLATTGASGLRTVLALAAALLLLGGAALVVRRRSARG